MAKPTEHTTKFGVDISELKAGISQANRQIKLLNAEFKAASAGMDDWDKSTDGISAKLKQLNGVLKQQESILENYEAQLAIVEKEQGSNSKAADDLRVKILNQQAAVKKTEAQIEDYNDRMGKAEKAQKKAAKSGKTVAEEFDNIDEEADDAEKSVRGLSDGFTVMRGTIANLVASGIKSVISGIGNAIAETQEWRKELSYLETNANAAGYSLGDMKDITKEVASVTGDTGAAVEGMSNIMATGMKDVQGIADGLAGAAIKWKDTLKFEGLADGLQETLATGAAVGSFGEMLERSGVNLENWNEGLQEAIKNGEEENYVLQTMADAGLYDVKEAYEEAHGAMLDAARAELDFTDNMSKLAEKAEPIQTAVKQGFADILGAVANLISGADFTAIADGISAGFAWFVDIGIPAIKTGFQWILDNKDALIAGFTGLATAVGLYMAYNTAMNIMNNGWKSLAIVQKAVTAAQWLMNAAMNANPIMLIISAVAGLVAAFIYLWNNCEGFREFWINLWEQLKTLVSEAWEGIKTAFSGAWDFIVGIWNGAVEFFTGIWESIKGVYSVVDSFMSEKFSVAWTYIKAVWDTVTGYFSAIWETIKGIFAVVKSVLSGNWEEAWSAIQGIVDTWKGYFTDVWDNIKGVFEAVKTWFKDIFSGAWTGIKNAWSGVKGWFSGIWTSIKNTFSGIKTWFSDKFTGAWDAIKDVFSGWGDFFGGLWTNIKDKFSSIGANIGSSISDSVKSGINSVLGAIEGVINKGIGLVNSAIDLANMLPGVSVGHVPTLSLPRLAQGGYIGPNRPTAAIIGDNKHAGEIVAPEDKLLEIMKRALTEFSAEGVTNYDPHGSAAASGAAGGRSMNFYQYNTSPKALSRLEIYRQTQNQLRAAAGVQ